MQYNTKNKQIYKRITIILFRIVLIAVAIFLTSMTANAGLISFFNSVVTGDQVVAKNNERLSQTSQTMVLPLAANNIDPNPEKNFEVLPVSGKEILSADLASANGDSVEASTKISVYTVRDGDTVSGIAKMFNVSLNTVLWANDLTSRSVLKAGQILVILPVSGLKYKVKKGDTISTITKKYQADESEIYSYNDLDKNAKLVVGQEIIIPNAEFGSPSQQTYVAISVNGVKIPYDPLTVNVKALPKYDGYYSCPVQGRLSQSLHGKNSVDLAAPKGTPLRAAAEGIVTISKSDNTWHGGYGNYVVISHPNNSQSLYAHMLSATVKAGERVEKGEIIGYVGLSGMTTGPHVHFEIRGAQNLFAVEKCI